MNNLDKITDKIIADAKAEADAVIGDAMTYADAVKKDSENRTEDILTRAKKDADKDSLLTVERAYSTADIKKRELSLATKVGLISKVFAEAEEKLCSLSDSDYCAFSAHLLCDAVIDRIETVEKLRREYGDEEEYSLDFSVVFNESDKKSRSSAIVKKAKSYLKKKDEALAGVSVSVSSETADISGGLILRYGDTETNCSVASVIASERENAEKRVCDILFGNGVESNE